MNLKGNLILLCLFALSVTEIAAQNQGDAPSPAPSSSKERNVEMFFRVTDNNIDSATAKNAILTQNSLMLNKAFGGTSFMSFPSAQNFKGKGFDWGMGIQNGIYKSNILVSYAGLKTDGFQNFEYEKSTLALGSGSTASRMTTTLFDDYIYDNNKLRTARIGYVGEILPWHANANKFLSNIGFRFGLELNGNSTQLNSTYNIYSSSFSSTASSGATTTSQLSSIDFLTQRKIDYYEAFVNGVIGLSYTLELKEKHRFFFSVEHFESVANSGKYSEEVKAFVNLGSAFGSSSSSSASPLLIPFTTKVKGGATTELVGNRFQFGYTYQFTELFGLNLSYGYWDATHTVTDSKVKETANPLTLIGSMFSSSSSSSSSMSSALLGFYFSGAPALGPLPSTRDVRSQISIAATLRY
ncbi:hypothetical protein LFX25_19185 [Leptospira sp. FAT2]|uniref:hypothetical protein n=1 Tax=Leptospira sanjuanensis TaxID=2879643 RepID=UPI001EE78A5C|nr:hypothetical protein [Leptospira sanjuanensis]MCG6170032.1 hypothetical protein [Leptospira sanjuanensis]MCG6195369.1 hypothetical protein [Leptospira sanjuanensis]